MRPSLEICVADLAGVAAAADAGADRVELCVNLAVGGTTPPTELFATALEKAPIGGVIALVRSRPGDFCYTARELDAQARTLNELRQIAAGSPAPYGFVVGALTSGGTLDTGACRMLRDAAGRAPLTFHRAFDHLADWSSAGVVALQQLAALGFNRVLTTGGHARTAQPAQLATLLAATLDIADASPAASVPAAGAPESVPEPLRIIASGGLRSHNLRALLRQLRAALAAQLGTERAAEAFGLLELHMRAPATGAATTGCADAAVTDRDATDPAEVAGIVAALR